MSEKRWHVPPRPRGMFSTLDYVLGVSDVRDGYALGLLRVWQLLERGAPREEIAAQVKLSAPWIETWEEGWPEELEGEGEG